MDQTQTSILAALQQIERNKMHGFGAPEHHQGAAVPRDLERVPGKRVFEADVITPKWLDALTEREHVVQRAHEIAAGAWGADFCRFVTGGSTQSLHVALSAVAGRGDTVLLAANIHKAECAPALAIAFDALIVPVMIDDAFDIEHEVALETLAAALEADPRTKALVVVSPTYSG